MFRPRSLAVALFAFSLSTSSLLAGDIRIPLPKKSKYTPVQKLNRDGVAAVQKHEYDKAKKLFYKAYLIDPNDPFTLNNLGYLAELEGDADRAQRFYQLSSEQNSEAVVDKATNDLVEGKPVSAVAGNAEEKGIKINRMNSQAITLLEKDRAPEADLVLQKALTVDSRNPFTLNNLGFAKEKEGELEAAYQFYTAAASTNSRERVEIAADKDWRGREISDVANDNAKKLRKRMRNDSVESRVAILNLRGVSAMNRNDRRAARDFIEQAYKLAPNDAFTLNNMGYVAEMDGDRETADYYYDRARDANQRGARISLATRKDVEGKKIGEVASQTDNLVLTKMDEERALRQQQGGPVLLRNRDNSPVVEPKEPVNRPQVRVSDANGNLVLPPLPKASPAPAASSSHTITTPAGNGDGLMMPLPENEQPTTVHQGDGNHGLIMPLPEDQQPGSQPNQQQTAPVQPQNQQQPPAQQGPTDHGLVMPLPDNQQPGTQTPPAPQTQPAPQQQQQPQTQQGTTDHGIMMPLPDNQQPRTQSAPVPQSTPAVPQQTAPVQPQSQPSAPAQAPPQSPGLLLPPPDNQQPQAQPQTQPQSGVTGPNNTGVYNPPAATTTTTSKPAAPKKISDNDPRPAKNNTKPNQTDDGVKKISDQ